MSALEGKRPGVVRGFFQGLLGAFRRVKSEYDAEGRFSKLRIKILGAFFLNLMVASVVGFVLAQPPEVEIEAWWQVGFPSNLIVIRSLRPQPLRDVHMVLDSRYVGKAPIIQEGTNGFEIEQTFLDSNHFAPPREHVPQLLMLHTKRGLIRLKLTKKN